MCEPEATVKDIEDLIKDLGRVRVPLEAAYWDEINRIQEVQDASNRNDEQPSFEND